MAAPKYIRTCSIWRALEVIGDKPTLLLLESYWLGTRRFSGFQKQTGLLKTVISDRLAKLVAADCFEKVLYSERPKRYEYHATEKFLGLYPAALSMLHWEQKWGAKSGKIQVTLTHKSCGNITQPKPVCRSCRADIAPRHVTLKDGPGTGLMPATYSRRRKSTTAQDHASPLFDEIAEIMGDRWSALIIRSVFTRRNHYSDICEDTAIATNILSERLDWLCDKDILKKDKALYTLTPKGQDIYPVLIALMAWGDKWHSPPDGPPLILTHTLCGRTLTSQMACSACGDPVTANDIGFNVTERESRA